MNPEPLNLEYRLFFYLRRQRIQRFLNQVPSQALFFLFRFCGITQGVGNRHRRNDTVGAHSLRYRHDGTNMNRQDPCLFYFLGQRCTATRAGPSRGGDDDRVDACLYEVFFDFFCEFFCIGDGGSVAHGSIEIRI